MFYDHPTPLELCNSLLMSNERREIQRAALLAHAGAHSHAERIRERLGYGAADCRRDTDKVSR